MPFSKASYVVLIGALALPSNRIDAQQLDAKAVLVQSLGLVSPTGLTIKDVRMEGNVRYIAGATQEDGSITLLATRDGAASTKVVLPSHSFEYVVGHSNSKTVGKSVDDKGITHTVATHNLLSDPAWFCPVLLVSVRQFYAQLGEVSAMSGVHKGDGEFIELTSFRKAALKNVRAEAELKRLSLSKLYLDPSSMQPTSYEYRTHPDTDSGSDIRVDIRYAEYRPFDGVLFPTHIQRYENGVLLLDIHINSARINSGLISSDLGF